MEFRGCNNFHYVQAIKNRVASKVPNIFRLRPKLKWKNIQEVYEATDAKAIDQIAVVRPKIEDSPSGSYRTIAVGQSCPEGVKLEVDDGVSDDLDFMTLREMKAICMANKRKRRAFSVSSEGLAQTASPVKQESSTSPFEVDDDDLIEPLGHWKSRILMRRRKKRKVRSNSVSTSSQMNLPVVLYKGIQDNQQFVYQSNLDVVACVPVKTEVPEPPYTDYQGDNDWLYYGGIDSGEESEPASVWDWESNMLLLSVEEGEETENCGLNTEEFSSSELQFCHSGEGGCIGNEVLALTYSDSDGVVEVDRELSPAISTPASAFGFGSNDKPETPNGTNLYYRMSLAAHDEEATPASAFGFGSNDKPETPNGTNLYCQMSLAAHDEEPKLATDQFFETKVSNMASKEYGAGNDRGFQSSHAIEECVLSTETAFGFGSNDKPETPNGTNLYCRMSSAAHDEEPKLATDQFFETKVSNMATKEYGAGNDRGFQSSHAIEECVLSTESYDHVEHPFCVSVQDAIGSAQRDIFVNVPEVMLQHPSDSFVGPSPSDDSSQLDSSCSSHILDHCKSLPSLFDEFDDRPGSLLSDDRPQDDSYAESLPISVHANVMPGIPSTCASPDNCLDSVSSNCPAVENTALFSACANVKGNSPTKIYSDADHPVTTIKADEVYVSKMQHPMQRLLSNRKIISPTSQKRLQKAMESAELDDEQYYKYARKLCYMKKIDSKIGGLEGCNQIKRTENTSGSKQLIRKETGDSYSPSHKGILKESSLPAMPRISSCSSVQSCSENAVAFSQRQMRDIETLTNKLTRELKCMKDIVEETLCSEFYADIPVKRTTNEVKVILRNATRAEVGAKRWLSMMSRDCNRFCKIMKLTGKDPPAPANVLSKEKRKIIFADEAGGKLCDVRIFANNTNASIDSESG